MTMFFRVELAMFGDDYHSTIYLVFCYLLGNTVGEFFWNKLKEFVNYPIGCLWVFVGGL
jgi:hypothetical protein